MVAMIRCLLILTVFLKVSNCGPPPDYLKNTFVVKTAVADSDNGTYNITDVLKVGETAIIGKCSKVTDSSSRGIIFKIGINTKDNNNNETDGNKCLQDEHQGFINMEKIFVKTSDGTELRVPAPEILFYEADAMITAETGSVDVLQDGNVKNVTVLQTGPNDIMGMTYLGADLLTLFKKPGDPLTKLFVGLDASLQTLQILYVYQQGGFIHRDLKPDNLVFGKPGSAEQNIVHVLDPAYAIFLNSVVVQPQEHRGTPLYFSTRIINEINSKSSPTISHLIDVFSGVCIITKLVTNFADFLWENNPLDTKLRDPVVFLTHLQNNLVSLPGGENLDWLIKILTLMYVTAVCSDNPKAKLDYEYLIGPFKTNFEALKKKYPTEAAASLSFANS